MSTYVVLVVFFVMLRSCYRLQLCCVGHDRAKNNSRLFSPVKAVIAGFSACMQWLVLGLFGVGLKAGYA